MGILDFLAKIWGSVPKTLRLIIIVAITILLIYFIPNLVIRVPLILFVIIYFILDVVCPYIKEKRENVQKGIAINKEEKRIEETVNNCAKRISPEKHFPYTFKIENASPQNKEHFLNTATKTLILRENIKENKSENIANFVSFAVMQGYVPQVWEYFTPKLSELLTYEKTREMLEKANDVEATKIYAENYSLKKRGLTEKDRIHYHTLKMENSIDEIFLPLIFYSKNKNMLPIKTFQKEIENLFYWLSDTKKRVGNISPTQQLPKMSYIYIKKHIIPISSHKNRIIGNFNKEKCELCILGAFKDFFGPQQELSNELSTLYPILKSFKGISLDKGDKEREARYIVHKSPQSDILLNNI